jgi:hypothetical protein
MKKMPWEHLQRAMCYVFVFITLNLLGCASQQIKAPIWPDGLPPRTYFLDQYRQDVANKNSQDLDEYLKWVIRFYKGWELYPSGWNNITQEVLLKINKHRAADEIKVKLERLGLIISAEWAKNNKTRIINTRLVALWGSSLLKSLEHGETLQLINRVTVDINNVLTRKIAVDTIAADRYYAQDEELL